MGLLSRIRAHETKKGVSIPTRKTCLFCGAHDHVWSTHSERVSDELRGVPS